MKPYPSLGDGIAVRLGQIKELEKERAALLGIEEPPSDDVKPTSRAEEPPPANVTNGPARTYGGGRVLRFKMVNGRKIPIE